MNYRAIWRSEIHPEGKSVIIENNTEEENIESLKALVRRFYLLPKEVDIKIERL